MDASKLRAWWARRQGLDGSLEGKTPAEVLDHAGWARSVGGVGPYLTLFSRAGTSKNEADAAVAKLQIHELPSARGCTYVVPAVDFALGLKIGQDFWEGGDMRTARKLGATDAEIEKLRTKVLAALTKAPLDPDGLKEALGNAVRNFGEEGKKKGITTTLPLALGYLQAYGEIRRIPVNGRLDQQRYRYTAWSPNPLAKFNLSLEEAHVELARRFFRWIAPATIAEFQAFAGISGKAAKAAVAPLGLVPVEAGSDRLLLPEDHDALHAFKAPKQSHYVLTSGLDAIALLRRDAGSLLEDADWKHGLFNSHRGAAGGALCDLPHHAILDRGRLVGFWEYDTETQSIAWASFLKKDKPMEAAVKKTESFVRDQLGDARSFSLDSSKSRAPKIEALRKASS